LQYFDGKTLSAMLKQQGQLEEPVARLILQRLASAIKYCHDIGVAHRDIKTDNILVDASNQPMLIDFAFGTISLGKKSESVCGTVSYMAPEILGKQSYCPRKADIWSFGIVAYKMLFGAAEHPFLRKISLMQALMTLKNST
jgi:serine/threonine protein kinase